MDAAIHAGKTEAGKVVRKLGRGLSSLVSIAPVEVAPPATSTQVPAKQELKNVTASSADGMRHLVISSIVPSPFQPRKSIDDAALNGLAASIRQTGLIQPVVVRPSPASVNRFELVAGERRWRAASLAGLATVPAIVRELSDEAAAEWALVENVQREDLNPMDRAWALRSLSERFRLSQQQLADRVGLERPTVANLVRLTELEPALADLIAKGALSPGHGKALLQMPPGDARVALGRDAAEKGWTVRRLEGLCRDGAPAKKPKGPDTGAARFAVLRDLERQISQHLGTKVSIRTDRAGKRGHVTIDFYGVDHFDGLMARLGIAAH